MRMGDLVRLTRDGSDDDNYSNPRLKKGDKFVIGQIYGDYARPIKNQPNGMHISMLEIVTETTKKEESTMKKTLRKVRIINKTIDKELHKEEAITSMSQEDFIRSVLMKNSAKFKVIDLADLHIHPYKITSYEVEEEDK